MAQTQACLQNHGLVRSQPQPEGQTLATNGWELEHSFQEEETVRNQETKFKAISKRSDLKKSPL